MDPDQAVCWVTRCTATRSFCIEIHYQGPDFFEDQVYVQQAVVDCPYRDWAVCCGRLDPFTDRGSYRRCDRSSSNAEYRSNVHHQKQREIHLWSRPSRRSNHHAFGLCIGLHVPISPPRKSPQVWHRVQDPGSLRVQLTQHIASKASEPTISNAEGQHST